MPNPYIPQNITVHLGKPDADAENITLSFPDYIKNVASSEIFPTWPQQALRANIYAQISFALNRIYTEWYRAKGYPFDITSSTQFDQAFVKNRDVFQNISELVDELFNDYIQKDDNIEPFFSSFCNGTTSKCDGLSQWGSVSLAQQGKDAFQILTHYYGDNIQIVENAPIKMPIESYPGAPLRLGDSSNEVQLLQKQLNRISRNYPLIPKIPDPNGAFGKATEDAVKQFQRTFKLTPDGIVGKATWYRIKYIYISVKKLTELSSEGIKLEDVSKQYTALLQVGEQGDEVRMLQYYLAVIANFYDSIPPINVDGTFGEDTKNAVVQFQRTFGLEQDGIVGRETWNKMNSVYRSVVRNAQVEEELIPFYPGFILKVGSTGENVRLMQEYLHFLGELYDWLPPVAVTGAFTEETKAAVLAFQQRFGLPLVGHIGPLTWDAIARDYLEIRYGTVRQPNQFGGVALGQA